MLSWCLLEEWEANVYSLCMTHGNWMEKQCFASLATTQSKHCFPDDWVFSMRFRCKEITLPRIETAVESTNFLVFAQKVVCLSTLQRVINLKVVWPKSSSGQRRRRENRDRGICSSGRRIMSNARLTLFLPEKKIVKSNYEVMVYEKWFLCSFRIFLTNKRTKREKDKKGM